MQAQQSCKEDVRFHPKHQGYVHRTLLQTRISQFCFANIRQNIGDALWDRCMVATTYVNHAL